jgi:hypothetical protein
MGGGLSGLESEEQLNFLANYGYGSNKPKKLD